MYADTKCNVYRLRIDLVLLYLLDDKLYYI